MAHPRVKLYVAEASGPTGDLTYTYNPRQRTEQSVMDEMEALALKAGCVPLYFEMGSGVNQRVVHTVMTQKLTKLYKSGNAELRRLLQIEEAHAST